jgi:hypothetical protein
MSGRTKRKREKESDNKKEYRKATCFESILGIIYIIPKISFFSKIHINFKKQPSLHLQDREMGLIIIVITYFSIFSEMSGTADRNVKIFNFEKQKRRKHPIRRKAPENLLKRARGLKTCMDLK